MGATMTTSSFAKANYPGVSRWWGNKYDSYKPQWPELLTRETSQRNYEEHVGTVTFGVAGVKPEGRSISFDAEEQGFIKRYTHITYGIGFIITEEAWEDDLYDVVGKRRAQGLAFSMFNAEEITAANIYNNGFSGAFQNGADGLQLFSASHLNMSQGTFSNLLTGDFSELVLEQGVIAIRKATNDRGLKIQLKPMALIVPPDLEFEVSRILNSELQSDSAEHNINVMRTNGTFPKVVISQFLTDTDAFFIRTNCPSGLCRFIRRAARFDLDNDFDTSNAKYKCTARWSEGWTDPRGAWGSAGV